MRNFSRRTRWMIGGGSIVAVLASASVAMGVLTGAAGTVQIGVQVLRQDAPSTTNAAPFVALPGAIRTFNVSRNALVVATFSAESRCAGATPGTWCTVQIFMDGAQMFPQSGPDFAFDSVEAGGDGFWDGGSMQRSTTVAAGTHTVQVRYGTTAAGTAFRLDDWHLTIEESSL